MLISAWMDGRNSYEYFSWRFSGKQKSRKVKCKEETKYFFSKLPIHVNEVNKGY